MKLIEKIEIVDFGYPIYHSEYVTWMIDIAKVEAKKRKEIELIYQKILGLIANPEDLLVENIRIFINGKRLTVENLEAMDLKEAVREIEKYPKITVEKADSKNTLSKPNEPVTKKIPLTDYLKKLYERDDVQFFYHTVPITSAELFISKNNHLIINEALLPYLRLLDLSKILFSNVDLRGLDLSLTNIQNIDFANLYKNSLENTNLEGVPLLGYVLKNICADKANLQGTYLTIELDSTSINETLLDSSIIIIKNGLVIPNTRTRKLKSPILHF